MPKSKVKSAAKLKKELDAIFSKYIRLKYADESGMVACYTCSTVKHWKEMQNGHWIPRNNLATRFEERNCRPQCVGCNMFNRGRPDEFAVRLIREGENLEGLIKTKHLIFKVDTLWHQTKIDYYTALVSHNPLSTVLA